MRRGPKIKKFGENSCSHNKREGEMCTHIHIEIERDGNTKLGRESE